MHKKFNRLLGFAAVLFVAGGLFAGLPASSPPAPGGSTAKNDQDAIVERALRRRTLAAAREATAAKTKTARQALLASQALQSARPPVKGKPLALVASSNPLPGVVAPPGVMNPLGTPDYISGLVPNYANSPLIRKFVDTLPGLGAAQANNLGNYIPVAVPDRTAFPASGAFPASDYYNIDLVDYTQKLHSDLPPTHLRGYQTHQTNITNGAAASNYLGPVIVAQKDRPVRIKFNNRLGIGAAGNLLLPVDTSLMGAGTAPTGSYTQNRAELHLHGGLTPWISDGTPHQWLTPAGETNPNQKGISFRNVPDMGTVIPGGYPGTANDGVGTYFYSNQQSSRLMFYHDHAFGLTRLNVYAGEAAGYLIVDPTETSLINRGIIPSPGSTLPISTDPWDPTPYNGSTHPVHQPLAGNVYTYGIPLVIQDKTFVPGPSDLANQDPTWDINNWGGYGDLWYPHVYMTNQNPYEISGANAMGRWDYGPWFWPIVPTWTDPLTPPPAGYLPYGHGVVPGANPGDPGIPGTPNPSLVPEAFMDTPVINGTPYPTVTLAPRAYRFRLLNAANDRMFNFAFYYADPANPTEVVMIPATQAESAAAAADFALKHPNDPNIPVWPSDGRPEGVVDWRTAGPDIIQIGTEGGFLPDPVVFHPQPTNYNYNRRDIVVLNIAEHGLFLGPAERADIIVDFSSVPSGSTLILYNDMLAPVPAFDVRYDYYTGDPDRTLAGDGTGGAPSTQIGYGPNTRTLMQVKIVGTAAATFDVAALQAAFKADPATGSAFANGQHLPIVPESSLNSALGTTYGDTYSNIGDYSLNYKKTETGLVSTVPLESKAIQELFELNWGRMNATLGIELPSTNFTNQTTIPLGYIDPGTEILTDGTTQLWKITHNGVDTHPVHFHLFDVQVVNRVGWDGAVRMPDANELGWKETVRMNPLEDIVVAFRPISPRLPFVLGNSIRVLDPTQPAAAAVTVTDVTAAAGNLGNLGAQISVSNSNAAVLGEVGPGYDFGWEYVWHCHILGHEENDFMRPVILNVANTLPLSPTGLTALMSGATRVDLQWTDGSVNETGFRVERRTGAGAYAAIGSTVPNQAFFTDFTVVSGTTYTYRVYSYNQYGDCTTPATSSPVTPGAITPASSVTLAASPVTSAPFGTVVTFTATATGSTGYQYQFLVDGVLVKDYSASAAYSFPTTQPVGTYTVQVNVRTSLGGAIVTGNLAYTITPLTATGVQLLPNLPSPQQAAKGIVFTVVGTGSAAYQYRFSLNGVVTQAYSATATYALDPVIAPGTYTIKADVRTNTASLVPDASTTLSYTILAATPATGVMLMPSVASPQPAGTAVVFTAVGEGASAYQYQFSLNGVVTQAYSTAATWTLPTATLPGTYLVSVQVRTSSAVATQDAESAITYVLSGAPYFTTQPVNTATNEGSTLSFTGVATQNGSGGTITYQWQFTATGLSWVNVAVGTGFTTSTWTISPLAVPRIWDTLQFRVKATNSFGTTISNSATVTVNSLPYFTTQPLSISVLVGSSASFTGVATATGSGTAITYQWQSSTDGITWTNVASGLGFSSSTYITPATLTGQNGMKFRVVATNAIGTATSNITTLTVTP